MSENDGTATTRKEVCLETPSAKVLGLGIGLLLYILFFLVSVSICLAHKETGLTPKLIGKIFLANVLYFVFIFAMPKEKVGTVCGDQEPVDQQGMIAFLTLIILWLSTLCGCWCFTKEYTLPKVFAITMEERMTGHTKAELTNMPD